MHLPRTSGRETRWHCYPRRPNLHYDLQTGFGISHPGLNLSTFQVKEENGDVFVKLPPAEELSMAFDRLAREAAEKVSFKPPRNGSHPDIKIKRNSEDSSNLKSNLDW